MLRLPRCAFMSPTIRASNSGWHTWRETLREELAMGLEPQPLCLFLLSTRRHRHA
jgi:hypothetical protein